MRPKFKFKSQIFGMFFCRNNVWIMENMDKELTVPKLVLIVWPKIPQIPQKISAQNVCHCLPKPKSLLFKKTLFLGVRSPCLKPRNPICEKNWHVLRVIPKLRFIKIILFLFSEGRHLRFIKNYLIVVNIVHLGIEI